MSVNGWSNVNGGSSKRIRATCEVRREGLCENERYVYKGRHGEVSDIECEGESIRIKYVRRGMP